MNSREEKDCSLRSFPPRELGSPFLNETLFANESSGKWESHLAALAAECPFGHAFAQGQPNLSEPEDWGTEAVEQHQWTGAAEEETIEGGSSAAHGVFADLQHVDPVAELEFEAAGCSGDHELLELDGELLDAEIRKVTGAHAAFRDRVLSAHIAMSQKSKGAAKADLSRGDLAPVAGTNIQMAPAAAAAAGRLLAAANADLAKAQAAGHADALLTTGITASSGYRGSAHQKKLWIQYFDAEMGYYDRTRVARERLADGPHSAQAVTHMLTPKRFGGFGLGGRIAAPGYSNHQSGIAIDFKQQRKKGHAVRNSSDDRARARWRSTWFYGWLNANAEGFGFQPIPTEEWHWEYRGGAADAASVSGATSTGRLIVTPNALPTPTTVKPSASLVRLAQRVLNAAEGERLSDDGNLGPLTRAALERFRKKYNLGTGGVFDAAIELALAQRALEELAQASMFAQPGTRDARTDHALITFKSSRRLGSDATLDAATHRVLSDALAGVSPKPRATATAPQTPTLANPATYLGGMLWTLEAAILPTRVAVFCPRAALASREVEMLLYAHGLLNGCRRPKSIPDGIITDAPFNLGDIVAASGRPIVLVVPYLDWANPGGESAFGKSRRTWHALGKPVHLNRLIAEVLADLGRVQSVATPSLRNLVIAGHSRAYDFLEPLAHFHADSQMQQGALASLSQVWAFDSTYGGNVSNWINWLAANPRLRVSVLYEPKVYRMESKKWVASSTAKLGGEFYSRKGGRLTVVQTTDGHCAQPAKRLSELLKSLASTADLESEAPWDEAEQRDRFDQVDEPDADEQHLSAEPELDSFAFEAMCGNDEHASTDDYAPGDEDEEFEFEDKDYIGQVFEDEAANKAPLPVPEDNPVPFAPQPPPGSFWPVRTSIKNARVVSYNALSGIVGSAGRMFFANRKGQRGGKQAARRHVGIDLFANIGDIVLACESGTIVGFSFFYKAKSGQRTFKLLIQHDATGVVVNYGEVTADSLSKNDLRVGSPVQAGQPIGFVSDTSMLHFETYVQGTVSNHRWWEADKTPPRQLLNPTWYLLFLREQGLPLTPGVVTQPIPGKALPAAKKPLAEIVRFAQRVLNATERERLKDDGDLGPATRVALERFGKTYNLVAGGILDDKTELALVQRALEEIRQQSLFGQLGVLDASTRQQLIAFRSERGLGFDATLDAATRAALTDALVRSASPPIGPVTVVTASDLPKLGAGHTPPTNPSGYRKFRLTTYHVVDQREFPIGPVGVPIFDVQGGKLAEGSPEFFGKLSLEGTARLTDGRLINVTGKQVAVSHDQYAEVLAYHRRAYAKRDAKRRESGQLPISTQYSGIVVKDGRVVRAFAFHEVPVQRRGIGYGVQRGIPYVPFRTLAADIGHTKYAKVDPKWKGKGGLVPPATHVFIKDFVGLRLPDGTTHDGWFVVNDTGGGIFGAHFDVFVGTLALGKQIKLPEFGLIWFSGIEQRIPPGYTYGLKP